MKRGSKCETTSYFSQILQGSVRHDGKRKKKRQKKFNQKSVLSN